MIFTFKRKNVLSNAWNPAPGYNVLKKNCVI